MANGVLYIASGDEYIQEARISANSVKSCMPNIEIALVTDENIEHKTPFDQIIDLPKSYPHSGISTIQPGLSPFDRTLFLDSDTYLTEPVYELFKILENHEIAFTLSPGRLSVPGLPDPWIEFNTGVIAYRQSDHTEKFFEEWKHQHERLLDERDIERNQPSFAHAIHEYNPDYFILPREYNCRVPRYGYLAHKAKIIHGRSDDPIEKIARELNSVSGRRVYQPTIDWRLREGVKIRTKGHAYRFKRFLKKGREKYEQEGLIPLIVDGGRYIGQKATNSVKMRK